MAHSATYHFPHFRLAREDMLQLDSAAESIKLHQEVFKDLPASGWAQSRWLQRRMVNSSPTKVHVSTHFCRLRGDGSEIGTYNSLYILIKQEGHWGVIIRFSFL